MRENIFVGLVAMGIGIYLLVPVLRKLIDKYLKGFFTLKHYSIKQVAGQVACNSEIRNRLLVTVLILFLLQLAYFSPLPGVNSALLDDFFTSKSFEISAKISIFALGLLPVTATCGLLLLFSVIIPPLRRCMFGEEKGRRKLLKYTLIVVVLLGLFQAYFLTTYLSKPSMFEGVSIVEMPGIQFKIIGVGTLLAGVCCLIFAAEFINRFGIGNGYALIVSTGLIMGMMQRFFRSPSLRGGILIIGMMCLGVYATCLIRKLEIKDEKGQKAILNFRLSWVGHGPMTLAALLVMPLQTLMHFWGAHWRYGYYIFEILEVILIIPATYLFACIVFDPGYVQNLLTKYGYSFSIKQNEISEVKYIKKEMGKVLCVTALFLLGGYFFPALIMVDKHAGLRIGMFWGSLGIWGIIGTFFDLLDQIQFFQQKQESGIKKWGICYISKDEIEATIKSAYLKSREINALVKPYRYTWGIPIRTIIDKYEIYVSENQIQSARQLILSAGEI